MATLSGEAGMAPTVEAPDLSGTQHTREADAPRRGADIDIRPQQIARGAALQIAEAFRPLSEGSIDVRLSPEELGRVRLSLVPGEAGLSVQIVAERAETLELLRRHADLLGAELRDAGYDGLSFSFGREGERDAQPDASERTADIRATPVLSSEDLRSRTAMPIIPSSGIDIRL